MWNNFIALVDLMIVMLKKQNKGIYGTVNGTIKGADENAEKPG